jgi:hypothetical protein
MRNIQDGFSQQCLILSWRANSPFLTIVVAQVRLSRNRGETVQVGGSRPRNGVSCASNSSPVSWLSSVKVDTLLKRSQDVTVFLKEF